jgi:hypothetical protein
MWKKEYVGNPVDLVYQCVASKVCKTSNAKNSAIVMATSRNFFSDYTLKTPTLGEKHHIQGISLKNVMDKFATLSSPNCRNFVASARRFVCNIMDIIDSIMVLKDNAKFKYIHDSQFPSQSINIVFVFKMSIDLAGSGIDLV